MRPSRFTRALIGGISALGIGALVAMPGVLPASAATHVRTFGPGHALHALYDVGVHSDVSVAQAREAALAATTFTQFKSSVKVGGTTYTYVLAGKNPKTAYTQPSGINPGYNVKLANKTLSPVTINVPNADAATLPAACGNGLLGDVNIDWLDGHLQ